MGLFSVGVLAAFLFAYQEVTRAARPGLLSKDDAVLAATVDGGHSEQTLRQLKIEATLLHVKQNGFSFVVDRNTLEDTWTLDSHRFPEYENQYLWVIVFTGSGSTVIGNWEKIIDAESGEILMRG
jgi:hypothetical protein